jgi:hypothetical protein
MGRFLGIFTPFELLGVAEGVEVDAELLALFVEVGALETEGAGDVGHMEIVASDFVEEDFAFEGFGALLKGSLPADVIGW